MPKRRGNAASYRTQEQRRGGSRVQARRDLGAGVGQLEGELTGLLQRGMWQSGLKPRHLFNGFVSSINYCPISAPLMKEVPSYLFI